jgi:MFS family permease
MAEATVPVPATQTDDTARPTRTLAVSHLVRISLYWLGLTAIDGAVGGAIQSRVEFENLVPEFEQGAALRQIGILALVIGIIVQPTVGSISDYTVSRWGRRKPYIFVGSVLDVVILFAIANSHTVIALAAFVALLSFSTNIARGPFQGYVPDLVPSHQVGLASAMVGLMQILGNVIGFALVALANIAHDVALALIGVAIVELVTMLGVVVRVENGPEAKPRKGRSWWSIAAETWGTDILRQRSYVFLVASRLFVLAGGAMLVNFVVFYLSETHGQTQAETGTTQLAILAVVVLANCIAIVPAARLSDRVGRKPVIYLSCALGAAGLLIAGIAPNIPLALVGAGLFGLSAGMFLAVDWALMTDIIPKASAGRYMGLSNVATGASTILALIVGSFALDYFNRTVGVGAGARVAYLIGATGFLIGALLLRPVVEPRGPKATAPPTSPEPEPALA